MLIKKRQLISRTQNDITRIKMNTNNEIKESAHIFSKQIKQNRGLFRDYN